MLIIKQTRYEDVDKNAYVSFSFVPYLTAESAMKKLRDYNHTNTAIVFADENLSEDLSKLVVLKNVPVVNIPYLGLAFAFIYNFGTLADGDFSEIQLVLDVATAAKILDGEITTWNDTALRVGSMIIFLEQRVFIYLFY